MGLKIGLWNCIIYFEIVVDFDDWLLKLDAYNEKWKSEKRIEFWKLNRRIKYGKSYGSGGAVCQRH